MTEQRKKITNNHSNRKGVSSEALFPFQEGIIMETIRKSSTGNAVMTMQTMLIGCGYSCGPDGADGDFGKNTLAAVIAFQSANGLETDGICGPLTWAALEKAAAGTPGTTTETPVSVGGCEAAKVLAVARAEIGYREKASNAQLDDKAANAGSGNYTKYARDFDQKYPKWYNGKKNGYAWCDMFVDWCFLTAYGYENALRLLCQPESSAGAGCTYSLRYYYNNSKFHTSGPKPGDQIFFGTSLDNSTHTGIVESVDATQVHTIEGNTSDQVARRSYTLSNSRILGYGRPAYDTVQAAAPTLATPALSATDGEKSIWDALMAFIGNAYGTAGLMGNLYAESALNPKNLQNNGNRALGMTDDEFTAAMDAGAYDNFVNDGYGYGLAQWTYHSRKAALLAYVKERGVSVGDFAAQLGFLCKELEGYSTMLKTLKAAKTVREASDVVLKQYERPADQGTAVQEKRAAYGQKYFDKYAGNTGTAVTDAAFHVKVDVSNLNIRTGPGTNYPRTGSFTGAGLFEIVETAPGEGSGSGWGRLKSGEGWIALDYATRI